MQEGGCHGAHTLQGEGEGGSGPEQPPGWEAPGFPRPLLGAATAAHLSSASHRTLPGTPVFLHPHTARHRPGDTHTALRIQEAGGQAAHAQTGLAGRGTNRSACHVMAGWAPRLAPAGLALCREGRGGIRDSQHRSDAGTWHRRFRWGSHMPADTPNTRAHRHSAHVHVHRCTQTSLTGVHTPPLQLPHVRSHTLSPTHTLTQHPARVSTHIRHLVSYTRAHAPSPLRPTLTSQPPCEPAPALLSTRDWPTRIRMLDARMDRQKFSRMMERSDFINLVGHSGQRQGS